MVFYFVLPGRVFCSFRCISFWFWFVWFSFMVTILPLLDLKCIMVWVYAALAIVDKDLASNISNKTRNRKMTARVEHNTSKGEDIKGILQVLIWCVIKCIVFILLTSPTHLCFVYIILAIYIKPLILVLGNSKQFWLVGKKTQNINFDISSWPWKLTRSLKSNADRDKLPQTSAHGTYLSYFQRVDIIQKRPYIY